MALNNIIQFNSQRTTWMRKDSLFLLQTMDHGLMPAAQAVFTTTSDQRLAGIAAFLECYLFLLYAGGNANIFLNGELDDCSFSQAPNKMQMEIKKDTVLESNDEARAALERVSSTLKQSKTVSRRHPGRREYVHDHQRSQLINHGYQRNKMFTRFNIHSTFIESGACINQRTPRQPTTLTTRHPSPPLSLPTRLVKRWARRRP